MPIPPGCTFLLQPLDNHVFAQLKRARRDRYQAKVGEKGGRALSAPQWDDVVSSCVYCFLKSKPWTHSFDHNGFGSRQQLTSERILGRLVCQSAPALSAERPSLAQIGIPYPKKARFDPSQVLGERPGADMILRIRRPTALNQRSFVIRLHPRAGWRERVAAQAASSAAGCTS